MTLLQSGLAKSLAADAYTIDNSLRFNAADSAYLKIVNGTPTNEKIWTWSAWIKWGNFQDYETVVSSAKSGETRSGFIQLNRAAKDGAIRFYCFDTTDTQYELVTDAVYRDPSAWYHVVCSCDATDVTAADRMQVWVNGERQSVVVGTNGLLPVDTLMGINGPGFTQTMGAYDALTEQSAFVDGYIAENYFIDGTRHDADSFGKLDSTTNQWIPIDASDLTFGNNGYYQKYSATELANSFADSADKNGIPVEGVHTDTSEKKFGTASAQFSGTDEELLIPESPDWQFGTQDFTIEMFMRRTSADMNPFYIAGSSSEYFRFNTYGVDDINVRLPNGIADFSAITSGGPEADTWHHVALVREGTTFTMYCNGSRIGSTVTSSVSCDTSGPIIFGSDGSSSWWIGYLDEIRVSVGIARYSGASYTIPTEAFTTDSYTKLLLHCDGADDGTVFTDSSDSAKRHTITPVGDVANTRAVRKIGDSSIKFDGTGDYLTLPDSSDWQLGGGTGDFTWEAWIYPQNTTDEERWTGQYEDGDNRWSIELYLGKINFYMESGGVVVGSFLETNAGVVTQDQWNHVAFVRSGSTPYIFVDGVSVAVTTSTAFGTMVNASSVLAIGRYWVDLTSQDFTGYMDEIRLSNSARYTSNFTPSTTAFTADANTKLLIHSNWDGGLGADSSGNYNTFDVTNLVATDQMIDAPTNNFATFNPLAGSSTNTYSEGNLEGTGTSGSWKHSPSTIDVSSGKWYWEVLVGSGTFSMGITDSSSSFADDAINDGYYYLGEADKRELGSQSSYGATYGTGDIISVALDLDSGTKTITFYKNNSSQGAITVTRSTAWVIDCLSADTIDSFSINFGSDSSFAGNKTSGSAAAQDDNEKGDFYYDVPAGYLALCTDNLSAPEIALPGENFNTVLYTGDGAADREIAGCEFQPDFSWVKMRSSTGQHMLFDAIRGAGQYLVSNNDEEDKTDASSLISFDSDGISVGSGYHVNSDTATFANWNWKAGGAPTADNSAGAGATPTAGSVKIDGSNLGSALAGSLAAIRISANTTAGFSIVRYTGTGSETTVGHGLSSAPELVIIKNLTSAGTAWQTGSDSLTSWVYHFALNETAAETSSDTFFGGDAPTASVFTIGTAGDVNTDTSGYITYCFHSVEGYSKIFRFTGNNNADGPFLYTGFKPAVVIGKCIGASGGWEIIDSARNTYNVAGASLYPNTNAVESVSTTTGLDFLSNGIKVRTTSGSYNQSNTMLAIAFAESPFKYSNAR